MFASTFSLLSRSVLSHMTSNLHFLLPKLFCNEATNSLPPVYTSMHIPSVLELSYDMHFKLLFWTEIFSEKVLECFCKKIILKHSAKQKWHGVDVVWEKQGHADVTLEGMMNLVSFARAARSTRRERDFSSLGWIKMLHRGQNWNTLLETKMTTTIELTHNHKE